ncbi:MAG: hypothetical protein DWQ02_16550 [Bacteroidetes bacterium]|nr:MAG: hypothetical protein DWQ02_16550 [Bacteroidota bacterium]
MLEEIPPPILSQKVYTFRLKTDPASEVNQGFMSCREFLVKTFFKFFSKKYRVFFQCGVLKVN